MSTKKYGLFFIAENKSIYYKSYESIELIVEAIRLDKELKNIMDKLESTKIQIIELKE